MSSKKHTPEPPGTRNHDHHPAVKTYTPRLEEFEKAVASARKRYDELPSWVKANTERRLQSQTPITRGHHPKSSKEQTSKSPETRNNDCHPAVKTYTPRLEEFEETVALARKRYHALPSWVKADMKRQRRAK